MYSSVLWTHRTSKHRQTDSPEHRGIVLNALLRPTQFRQTWPDEIGPDLQKIAARQAFVQCEETGGATAWMLLLWRVFNSWADRCSIEPGPAITLWCYSEGSK
jgi:hypothetical protein